MSFSLKAGLATATFAVAACATVATALAADLGGQPPMRGPIMGAPQPVFSGQRNPPGPCYFRADVGYSWSQTPDVRWPVTDPVTGFFVTDQVTNATMENTWFGEAGFGCGSGSRGLRGEVMLGYRGERKLDGEPGPWFPDPLLPPVNDPLHTTIRTYTLMFNAYHDLGNWHGFVPYVGAGIGLAYNMMDEVYFTGNPALVNRIAGDRDLAFAWSLMAGVGYQISPHAILDFGYRYMDMGKATSERHDTAGFVNPRVVVRDIEAHEFKVGLRYHFGVTPCCTTAAYDPLK